MSLATAFKSVEEGAVKVVSFVVKEMSFAEEILGAGTGSAKANLVITSVEAALQGLGLPVGAATAELKVVVDALTEFLTKAGVLLPHTASTPPSA